MYVCMIVCMWWVRALLFYANYRVHNTHWMSEIVDRENGEAIVVATALCSIINWILDPVWNCCVQAIWDERSAVARDIRIYNRLWIVFERTTQILIDLFCAFNTPSYVCERVSGPCLSRVFYCSKNQGAESSEVLGLRKIHHSKIDLNNSSPPSNDNCLSEHFFHLSWTCRLSEKY